ncbi:MAG TPA: hypothetical protein VFV12_08785 [Xanthobacteraceae bacterium]|nr:hypothetical protein [Xanthobacteraceae bacterium]
MSKVTYLAREGDPPVTHVAGVTFPGGVAVDLPPHKEWLAEKLKQNSWFAVEQDKPAHEGPSVETPAPQPPAKAAEENQHEAAAQMQADAAAAKAARKAAREAAKAQASVPQS